MFNRQYWDRSASKLLKLVSKLCKCKVYSFLISLLVNLICVHKANVFYFLILFRALKSLDESNGWLDFLQNCLIGGA